MRWGDMRRGETRFFETRWRVEREVQVWSMKCAVWRVQCEVWRKCSLGVALPCGRAPVMFLDVLGQQLCSRTVQQVRAKHAFTHGPGWRTLLASSIGEKGLLIKSKSTSAPPRAGTTGTYILHLAHFSPTSCDSTLKRYLLVQKMRAKRIYLQASMATGWEQDVHSSNRDPCRSFHSGLWTAAATRFAEGTSRLPCADQLHRGSQGNGMGWFRMI